MAVVNSGWLPSDFSKLKPTMDGPSYNWKKVTFSDTVDFDFVARALNAEVEGTVTLVKVDGVTETFFLQKGYNPIMCTRIKVTGSAVINVWALF